MAPDELAPLAVLALVDSTSVGTLLIPVWLMLAPRLRAGRVLLYLGMVAVTYLLLGLVLLSGGRLLVDEVTAAATSTPGTVVRLAAGITLLVLGLTIEPLTKDGKRRRADRAAARRAERGPGRLERWHAAITEPDTAVRALLLLALAAVGVEAASMVPYLAAIAILAGADLAPLAATGTMAGYCLVMIAPALFLLAVRTALRQRATPTLERLESWLVKNSREALAWVLFLLGLYLTTGAASALGSG